MATWIEHGGLSRERERWLRIGAEARRWVAPLGLAAALSALLLVALRVDILQLRYALTESYRLETTLAKRRAEITTDYWKRRDPMAVGRKARASAFASPGCVIEIPRTPERGRIGCGR